MRNIKIRQKVYFVGFFAFIVLMFSDACEAVPYPIDLREGSDFFQILFLVLIIFLIVLPIFIV